MQEVTTGRLFACIKDHKRLVNQIWVCVSMPIQAKEHVVLNFNPFNTP